MIWPPGPPPPPDPPRRTTTSVDDLLNQAHEAGLKHLRACWAAFDENSEGGTVQSPASDTFDGCDDCEVREVLHAAWPFLRQAVQQGAQA
jgi:hypothetical protein